jgi:ABC-type polar amino acid transport system ATPase subunit
MAPVTIRNIQKRYGSLTVLHGIDLEIRTRSSWCSSVPRAAGSPRSCG